MLAPIALAAPASLAASPSSPSDAAPAPYRDDRVWALAALAWTTARRSSTELHGPVAISSSDRDSTSLQYRLTTR